MAANPIVGGDEVNAVVVDIGGCLCRGGYSGDDTPKAVFPSAAGVVGGSEANGVESGGGGGGEGGRSIYIGNEALSYRRDNMQVVSPMGPDDLVADWDIADRLVSYALKDRLRVAPDEYAIMLAEPTHNTRAAREKAVTALFESQRCPALFLAKAAVLSAFAVGKQTALVVDAGYRGTTVAAVHEGYVLNRSVSRTALGGALLTRCVRAVLDRELGAKGRKLLARHMVKRGGSGGGDGKAEAKPADGGAAGAGGSSVPYDEWALEQVAADAKEALCRVGDTFLDPADAGSAPTATYELPDGTELTVGADRFRVCDTLFNSSLVNSFLPDGDPLVQGRQLTAWPSLVKSAIEGCDGDVRREFWNGIVLAGGTSLLPNVRERLEAELAALAPGGTRVKVSAPTNPAEKRFAAWIGGSILSSLGTFQQMWMSRAEYDEHGAGLIHRKSP